MTAYKCMLNEILTYPYVHLVVTMTGNHDRLGDAKGQKVVTSKVKSIDFERGIAVTQNSIYTWEK